MIIAHSVAIFNRVPGYFRGAGCGLHSAAVGDIMKGKEEKKMSEIEFVLIQANRYKYLLEGFAGNCLIVMLSCILPLGLGVVFTLVASRSRTAAKVFRWVSLPFECLCPAALMTAMYFAVFAYYVDSGLVAIVFAFALSFFGYMPARYHEADSFAKNLLVNGLGLISAMYRWSFCAGLIAYKDLLRGADIIRSRTFVGWVTLIPLFVSFFMLLVPEIVIRILKQKMH